MDSQRTHRDAAIARLSRRQYGIFTREQAVRAGFTTAAIKKRLSRGQWMLADHNVYRMSATPGGWNQRLLAACLAGPAVASHRSAGALWALSGMPNEIVEVTALRHRRRRNSDVIWHESFHLGDRDVTEIEGIPATRPVRTFIDLGVVLSGNELEVILNECLRRKLLSIPAIARRLDEFGPLRPGRCVVSAVLERQVHHLRVPESVLETRFLQLVRSAGLPEPVPQFHIPLAENWARVDFAYPSQQIAIEVDGAAYHSGEHTERRDRRRENELSASGWRVLRFDWDDVTRRPKYVVTTMRALGAK